MKEGARFWVSLATLVAVGVTAGIAWRVELERRFRWDSLLWISKFHWTVPVAMALFIVWAACFAPVRNRVGFAGALMAFVFPGYLAATVALQAAFGRFGSGFVIALVLWLAIPSALCLLYRLFGVPITILKTLGATLLFAGSWPIAIYVRRFFEDRGGSDTIHALKSGFVIPFLVIALGLPLLPFAAAFSRKPVVK